MCRSISTLCTIKVAVFELARLIIVDLVSRAVSMFEKEALIYQHVMAIRSERDRQADAASIGSRESDR